MFKNMMMGANATGPQGLMNHANSVGDGTFAPTGFGNNAGLGGNQLGGAQSMSSTGVGGQNRTNNGLGDSMAATGFQMNLSMNAAGNMGNMSQNTIDMEARSVQAMNSSGLMRPNVTDVSMNMKRKVNSRTGSNSIFGADIYEPKRFDVLDTYEQASIAGNYKSLEYSIFSGGIDTGIDFGELSVFNNSLFSQEVIDSISGEKKSGIGTHSSISNQNIQLDKHKFSDRFLGPFC